MRILHTITLNLGDRLFDITVNKYFKPKTRHSNESVYCKRINIALKI